MYSTYSVGYKASEATSQAACFALKFLFYLQNFCLNNKIYFSLANASFKRKMVLKSRFLLVDKQQTNFWLKLPTILPGLAGKIVKKTARSQN